MNRFQFYYFCIISTSFCQTSDYLAISTMQVFTQANQPKNWFLNRKLSAFVTPSSFIFILWVRFSSRIWLVSLIYFYNQMGSIRIQFVQPPLATFLSLSSKTFFISFIFVFLGFFLLSLLFVGWGLDVFLYSFYSYSIPWNPPHQLPAGKSKTYQTFWIETILSKYPFYLHARSQLTSVLQILYVCVTKVCL